MKKKTKSPLTFVCATGEMFSRWFDYRGRSNRNAFWKALIGIIMMGMAWMLFSSIASSAIADYFDLSIDYLPFAYLLLLLGWLMIYIPFLSLCVRRLRDAGYPPWLGGVLALPTPAGLILFFLCAQPSQKR